MKKKEFKIPPFTMYAFVKIAVVGERELNTVMSILNERKYDYSVQQKNLLSVVCVAKISEKCFYTLLQFAYPLQFINKKIC